MSCGWAKRLQSAPSYFHSSLLKLIESDCDVFLSGFSLTRNQNRWNWLWVFHRLYLHLSRLAGAWFYVVEPPWMARRDRAWKVQLVMSACGWGAQYPWRLLCINPSTSSINVSLNALSLWASSMRTALAKKASTYYSSVILVGCVKPDIATSASAMASSSS